MTASTETTFRIGDRVRYDAYTPAGDGPLPMSGRIIDTGRNELGDWYCVDICPDACVWKQAPDLTLL